MSSFLTKSLFFFSVFCLLVLHLPSSLFAQSQQADSALGVARMIEVRDKNVKDGNIISSADKGAKLSDTAYDPQVIGIVSEDAGILFASENLENGVPVMSVGKLYVMVSARDGGIKRGDLLTTSTIPGVAMRANKDGYVLGMALEDFNNPNPQQTEKIAMELNLHYFNAKPTLLGSLTDILKFALLPTKDAPTPIFKYLVAAFVVIASFILGFMTFGRTAAKGVEALGRNPAASKIIHVGIVLNIGIVVIIILAGLTVAFLILRL
jgi:F0F1-type ATP synthase membrane subunit c/vacuolar-type H+-ATPase subunit K